MSITFTTGLMGSGKSKTLINEYSLSCFKQQIPIAFAATIKEDFSDTSEITSRNGNSIKCYSIHKKNYNEILTHIRNLQKGTKVFIDEVQFLPLDFIKSLFFIEDIDIHLYGLLETFTADYFETSDYLIKNLPKRNIEFIGKICDNENCLNMARRNGRIIDGKIVYSGETFVESKQVYKSLCTYHYTNYNN